MIPARLQRLLGWSIAVFVAHGIEEYATGFPLVNPSVTIPARYFATIEQGMFAVFQLLLWLLLVTLFLLVKGQKRLAFRMLAIVGIVQVTEVHHLIAAVVHRGYYPGLATALLFPGLAIVFWRALLREWRAAAENQWR
jgi:hypothetical protein